MLARELKIGNYVMVENELLPNYKNQPLVVTSIQQRNDRDFPNSKSVISCDVDKYNSVSQFDEFIRPIPLTEEWLLKFGFERKYDICFCNHKLIIESSMGSRYSCRYRINPDESIWIVDLHYVHQLQNLYFALTGEELKITN